MPDAYRVALTPGALADLDRLDSFLRQENPSAANRMLATLNAAFDGLSHSPMTGRPVPDSRLRVKIVRFGKGGYACLNEVRERLVLIARLFHTREDWKQGQGSTEAWHGHFG